MNEWESKTQSSKLLHNFQPPPPILSNSFPPPPLPLSGSNFLNSLRPPPTISSAANNPSLPGQSAQVPGVANTLLGSHSLPTMAPPTSSYATLSPKLHLSVQTSSSENLKDLGSNLRSAPTFYSAVDKKIVPVSTPDKNGSLTPKSTPSPTGRVPRSSSNSRLDPSQMPRPERGAAELSYHTRSGSGRRNPPSCNSLYTAIDTGNCMPRHMRITMAAPPSSQEVLNQVGLPFAIVATPFASPENGEEPVTLVDMSVLADHRSVATASSQRNGDKTSHDTTACNTSESSDAGPPRCGRCRGYVNPSVIFTDDGHRWTCNLCGMTSNPVPDW
jgi:hypothetical protein